VAFEGFPVALAATATIDPLPQSGGFVSRNLSVFSMIVLVGMIMRAPIQTPMRPSPEGVQISYALDRAQITLHEPVIVIFKLTNSLSTSVIVDMGQNRENGFSYKLTQPDGSVADSPSYVHEGISAIGRVVVGPGQDLSQELLVNDRLQLNAPGTYKLEGHLTQQILDEQRHTLGTDPGFSQIVNVGPRDENQLRKTCEKLSDGIEASTSYADAARLARSLSCVTDPVAFRFSTRLFKTAAYWSQLLSPVWPELGIERPRSL
jgi:hypothetical protein